MTDRHNLSSPCEPERYELRESPAYTFEIDRRAFLQAAGAGVLITIFTQPALSQRAAASDTLEARLHLGDDGAITILTGKVEEGQGPRTELAMAAAEELRVPLERIRIVMADTDVVPSDGITAGSRTTPGTVPTVRKAAAVARQLLLNTASSRWNLPASELQLRDGVVSRRDSSGTLGYSDLSKSSEIATAYKGTLPADAPLSSVKDWQTLGRPRPHLKAKDLVTGSHQFPSDIVRPGMLYGSVLRPPSYGAALEDLDLAPAKSMAGVVSLRDGEFAGCAAPTSFAARQAVKALAAGARWKTKTHPSSSGLFEYLRQHPTAGEARPRGQSKGSTEAGLKTSAKRLQAAFQVAYVQHAPMEPRAAVAEWQDGKLTVWTGSSNPFGVRDQLARAFQIPPAQVRVIVPDMGGGFGGKHTGEAALEAARLAREARRPVSLRWTRAEEFAWAYFRPAGVLEIEAGIDEKGALVAWDFANYSSGTAAIESPYRIPNTRTRFIECEAPLRQGSYRALASTANNFARECFMDELASAAGLDPFDFRLASLENTRLRDVLVAAVERFGWRQRRGKRQKGSGVGLACGTEKNSYVAACVEVAMDETGAPRLVEICQAYECGAILNPGNLGQQVEGCILQGLGAALREEIQFENGRLTNGSFARYKVPRFRDVPKINLVLLDRKDLDPIGAGETPIIAVAPAMANALFEITGDRVRSLPLRAKAVKS